MEKISSIQYMKELGEYVTKLSPLIIGVSFVASVCFDYGFLYQLNLSFMDVPTSVQDHLRSSLNWLPYMVVLITFMYVFGKVLFTSKEQDNKVSSQVGNICMIGLCIFSIELSIIYIRTQYLPDLILSATNLIIALIFNFSKHPMPIVRVIVMTIYFAAVLFCRGYSSSDKLISKSPCDVVYLEDKSTQEGIVLRHYDSCIMFYGPESKSISFIERSKVIKIVRTDS